jgi:hypothetical protein
MPEREAAIDRLLSRPVRTGEIPDASPECLDAETLAAWVDGSLAASETAAAEGHTSSCARCQTMLASLVRTMPAPPIAQPWWRRRWAMAGLVPLTAGAVALAIWVRTPEPARTSVAPAQEAFSPSVSSVPPPLADERREQVPSEPASHDAAARPRPSSPPALNRVDVPQPGAKDALKQSDAVSEDQEKKNEALQKADAAPTDTLAAAAPRREVAGRAASVNEAAPARAQFRANAAEIAAPDGSSRWRLGAAGSIQRSVDGGATWAPLASGTTHDLVAGSAPTSAVCWIVGRVGTVLLTIDGRTWRLLSFPEQVDLVAVQARDALSASVTTADGRTFRTADGGRSWTAVQEI